MAVLTIDQYVGKRDSYNYPTDNVNPVLKRDKQYFTSYCQALIADYANNLCEIPFTFGSRRSFRELEQYATGTQNLDKIKDQIIGAKRKKNGRYNTKMNISWDGLAILPKLLDVMRSKNMRNDYDIDALCIDSDSQAAKENDRLFLKFMVMDEQKEFIRRTGYKNNTPLDPQQLNIETTDDVDLYFETGAYVMQREIASIAACNNTKMYSNYKSSVQDPTFDDLIKFGISGWKTEIDKPNKTVKIRKVKMYNEELDRCPVIIPYSQNNNFEGLSRAAEIRTITIAEVRSECPWMTAAELIYLAQSFLYMNAQMSSIINSYSVNSYNATGNIDPLNRCKILVLDAQWLSVDIEKNLKNQTSSGRVVFKEVPFDYQATKDRERKGDKVIQKKIIKKFYCKWVVGSDIVIDSGVCEDVVYYGPDGNKCPKLDYFFAKTGNMPLIERCIAIVDDINLANIKMRNELAAAIPAPNLVIQTGLMDNVFLNGIKQEPEDGIQTLVEKGYLFVNAVDDSGKPIFSNQKLIDKIDTNFAQNMNVYANQIANGVNNLREVLGLPQGTDASTPNPYNGAKKTELSMASSNEALYPTFNAFQYIFEPAFDDVVKKWQVIAQGTDLKVNYIPLGSKNMKVLALNEEFTNAEYNIRIVVGNTEEEQKQLLADITNLKNLGITSSGAQGITYSEYLYLYQKIKSGNINEAMFVFAKIERKKVLDKMAQDKANQQTTINGQIQSAQMAEKSKQDTAQLQGAQDRQTSIVTEGQKRKTAITNQYLKGLDTNGEPLTVEQYQALVAEVNQEISPILSQDQQIGQDPQQQQQNAQQQQMVA